jgi:hypothetical protein
MGEWFQWFQPRGVVVLCGLTFQSRIEGSVEVGMALLKWPRS